MNRLRKAWRVAIAVPGALFVMGVALQTFFVPSDLQIDLQPNPVLANQDPALVVPFQPMKELRSERALRSASRMLHVQSVDSAEPTIVSSLVVQRYLSEKSITILPGNQDGVLIIEDEQSVVRTALPLYLGKVDEILVQTANKRQEVIFTPDNIVNFALQRGIISSIDRSAEWNGKYELQLILGAEGLAYEINGTKQGKLFGVFSMTSPIRVLYSSETGVVLRRDIENEWFDRLAMLIL